jgi:hypothetical protein
MGNKFLITVILLIFCCSIAFGQLTTISGKVIDGKTGAGIPGATVKTGGFGTSTNASGQFVLVVQQAIVTQFGIGITCVGYQKQHHPFKAEPYNIKLSPVAGQLAEVVIVSSESIVRKAIRKIPLNYPVKSFMMTGQLKKMNEARDSSAYHYFYRNDAQIKMYYPPYTDDSKPNVTLIHKTDTLAADPKSTFNVHFVGGYTGVAGVDFVHSRTDVLDPKTKQYQYTLNGKDWINNHRVFVVNYYAVKNSGDNGILYIDTASYAFVRITLTKYHVKPAIFIPIDKTTMIIDYEKQGGKWYLQAVKGNSITRHKAFDLSSVVDYQSTGVDTVDVKPLPYKSIIPEYTEDIKVANPAEPLPAISPQVFTTTIQPDTGFTHITIPMVDTSGVRPAGLRAQDAIGKYIIGDNIHYIMGLAKLPLNLSGYQPILSRNIGGVSTYGIVINSQFRLYHGLFLQFDGQFNFGIGGIKNSETSYILTYDFIFNKGGHPVTLSPVVGYSDISLSKKKTAYYAQDSRLYGLNLNFEISPRVGYFINAKYYDAYYKHNLGLLLTNQQWGFSSGFLFRLKF